MSEPHGKHGEAEFQDFKKAFTRHQAIQESNRCLYCYDAPCIRACPTGIDVPKFIRRIANENVKGAAKAIFDANILGMSCARVCPVETLCAGSCVYNDLDMKPIEIGKLQRYATDAAFDAGWKFYEAGKATGKKVACIGGGPASLAAAHRLRRFGHAVTVFEKGNTLGGLNTSGIAAYKMKASRSLEEVQWLLDIGGIDIQSNVEIPRDRTWGSLADEFDAIFIGFGLGADSFLELSGSDAEGIRGAVDFIADMKLNGVDLEGVENAVVIGGGNTALDAVRALAGLGVPDVTLAYRGTESRMSGYGHEWAEAKKEGVRALWCSQPVGFRTEGGRVSAVLFERLHPETRENLGGIPFAVSADLVLLAIGQGKLGQLAQDIPGLTLENGKIVTDSAGRTGASGFYAGGDCRNGGKEVVNAVAEGRDAAEAMHEFLAGGGTCQI